MINYVVTPKIADVAIAEDQILIQEDGVLAFDISNTQRITILGSGGGAPGEFVNWPNVLNTPTTLAGYGITDAAAKIHNHDALYSPILHTHDDRYSLLTHNHDTAYLAIDGTAANTLAVNGVTAPENPKFTDTVYTHPESGVSGTHTGPLSNQTLAYNGTFIVPYLEYDLDGHITLISDQVMTMPGAPAGGGSGIYVDANEPSDWEDQDMWFKLLA